MAPAVEEGWFKMEDGKEVWTKTYTTEGPPTANLIFLHGFSDHIDRYKDLLFPRLAGAGIRVHAFDQRGWGRSVTSAADRGLTGPTAQVMADIAHFVRAKLDPALPNYLMGHSMGGQETAYFLATAPRDVTTRLAGAILSSPFIAFGRAVRPPKLKVVAGRFAGKWLPKFQLLNAMDPALMSHDAVLNQDWKDDPLCHDLGTLEGLAGMIDRAESLEAKRVAVEEWEGLRVLLLHGDEDSCCDAKGAQEWLEGTKVANKEVKIYKGGLHCVFAEPEHKEQFVQDVIAFVTATPKTSDAGEAQSKL